MAPKAISLRYHLVGEVEEFLREENMACVHTQAGLVELINQISTYKEEGKSLFPEVYIADDLDSIRHSLVNTEFLKIGRSERSDKVILKALKKCAPLAFGGWCIYILRDDAEFEYGLFRSGATIISMPISKTLIEDGNKENNLFLVRQVADKVVEVVGVKGQGLTINFGIRSTSNLSPLEEQKKFIEEIIKNVDEAVKDQLRIFYSRLFLYVIQNGHGNLCVVLSSDASYPEILKDGIVFENEIMISDKVKDLLPFIKDNSYNANSLEINSRLNGVFNLAAGMMMSDGITVFSDKGTILGYNIFIKHPEEDEELKKVEGGARSRTYTVLIHQLSDIIKAVYIQSQDGKTQTQNYE
jgi:hypothetical protein